MSVAASAAALQSPTPADCRHSRAGFDQGFHIVSRRADLSSDAKVVHAYLVSQHRSGRDETQRQIAEKVGLTRHQVWSAIHELVVAGDVQVIRYGLGRPNGYILLGLSDEDLAGTARPESAVRPVRTPRSGQSGNLARAGTYGQKKNENAKKDYRATRDHGGTDYLETRYGKLLPRTD